MANIKTGKDIKDLQDIKNLVVALILRSNKFRKERIEELAYKYLKGSGVKVTQQQLSKIVENYLDLFQRNSLVRCENGVYQTVSAGLMMPNRIETQQNGCGK